MKLLLPFKQFFNSNKQIFYLFVLLLLFPVFTFVVEAEDLSKGSCKNVFNLSEEDLVVAFIRGGGVGIDPKKLLFAKMGISDSNYLVGMLEQRKKGLFDFHNKLQRWLDKISETNMSEKDKSKYYLKLTKSTIEKIDSVLHLNPNSFEKYQDKDGKIRLSYEELEQIVAILKERIIDIYNLQKLYLSAIAMHNQRKLAEEDKKRDEESGNNLDQTKELPMDFYNEQQGQMGRSGLLERDVPKDEHPAIYDETNNSIKKPVLDIVNMDLVEKAITGELIDGKPDPYGDNVWNPKE